MVDFAVKKDLNIGVFYMKLKCVLVGIFVVCISLATISHAEALQEVSSFENENTDSSENDMKEKCREWYRDYFAPMSDDSKQRMKGYIKSALNKNLKMNEAAKKGDISSFCRYDTEALEMVINIAMSDCRYVFVAIPKNYDEELKSLAKIGGSLYEQGDTKEILVEKCFKQCECKNYMLSQQDKEISILIDLEKVIAEEESKESDQ